MPKPKTTAAISIVKIIGQSVEVSTAGTRAAPGSSIVDWSIDWKDGTVNKQVLHRYDQAGEYNVTLTVIDSKGRSDTAMIIIRLDSSLPVPLPLQFITPSLPAAQLGVFYSQQLQGTGGVLPYNFSLFSGSFPPGISLVGDTVQGTPTNTGTFNFTIRLQDSVGTQVFRNFSIQVTSLPLQILSSSPLPNASQGEFYSFPLNITGGVPPYVLTKPSGNFPTGISISGTSLIGTPTVLETQVFTLRVTDNVGTFVDKVFSLTVALESRNDFFEELIARPDLYFSFSGRNQSEIDAMMAFEPGNLNIIRSSPSSPTVVDCGWNPVTILSSINGVITTSGAHGIPVTASYTLEIIDHSLGSVNGVHEVVRLTSTTFQIVDASISGSGTGGTAYRSDSKCHDQALVVINNHVAIPNGTYVGTRLNHRQVELRTLAGAPVSSSGGSNVGTMQVKCWEYFPDTGRVDPASDPQDGSKGVVPVYQGSDLNRQFRMPFTGLSTDDWLLIYEFWFDSNMRQPVGGPKVPSKIFRTDGVNVIQQWGIYQGRVLNIDSIVTGNPTLVNVSQEHYYLSGDVVAIEGNGSIPNGNYAITPTGARQFSIPVLTSSGSGTGTVEHISEVCKLNYTFTQAGAGFEWFCGYNDVGDNRLYPTGVGGPNVQAGYFGSRPVFAGRWNRVWQYMRMNLKGSAFSSWNTIAQSKFGPSHIIGRWNVSATVDGSGVATITCLDGPHGFIVGNKVEITGITGVNGIYTIATVPASPTANRPENGGFTGPTTFTINGATPGASGSGIVELFFNMLSCWIADEFNNPATLLVEIPIPYYANYNTFRHEFDSSNDDEPMVNQIHFYTSNTAILLNPSSVNLGNTTLFRKPVG